MFDSDNQLIFAFFIQKDKLVIIIFFYFFQSTEVDPNLYSYKVIKKFHT